MKAIPIRQISAANKEQTEQFNIRTVKSLLNGVPMIHDLHRHDYFFILVLQKGSGEHEIDFTGYPVHDHSIFILRPGQVHRLKLDGECEGFLVEFNSAFYYPTELADKQRLRRATSKNTCSLNQSVFEKFYAALTNIHKEYNERQTGYADVIRANLEIFFIEFLRQSDSPNQLPDNDFSYEQERFEEFRELLEQYVSEHKSVIQYAEMLGVSVYQLNRITKDVIGKTVSQLINDQLILESKRHLLATSNQVKDIAYSVGFEDISYFTRFFKKNTGFSPEAFRSQFK